MDTIKIIFAVASELATVVTTVKANKELCGELNTRVDRVIPHLDKLSASPASAKGKVSVVVPALAAHTAPESHDCSLNRRRRHCGTFRTPSRP